jgi:acetyl-CoA carboxylase alpha subunit
VIYCRGDRPAKRSMPESAWLGPGLLRKAQHLVRLAHKFKLPILVCVVDPPGSSGAIATDWSGGLQLPKHLLAQWLLDAPILLAVLTKRSSFGVFGVWLADKTVALDQTSFALAIHGQRRSGCLEVDMAKLNHGGIIDGTISALAPPAGTIKKARPSWLKQVLIQMLDEVARSSPKQLRADRLKRLARVEGVVARLCRGEK